ncbi:MAG: pyridoxamine 5'-phosphate oxidase family protein [Bacteroidaceae bacterium]|nr:pyridoxamine 5'-phosphate oxidase family protein [Bacteroidaceae bacterium]
MRKASREMDAAFALEVLDKAPYVTMSMTRPDGRPYGIPLSLVRTDEKTFYFHCALEGEKLECIAHQPIVSLSAVTRCTPTVGPKDGSFTLQYKSATAVGRAELVQDDEEKIAALRAICQRFLPQHMEAFDEAVSRSLSRTAVVRITLMEPPVGKRKQYDKQGDEMKWGRME